MKSLLIANRGEIAARIARTARSMGIRSIAVASDVDQGSVHAKACDQVVHLQGVTPAETYLKGDQVIAAALAAGADAIHPGYGFLSEDPDFAQAVQDAGLIWVGPPPSAIRAMGLKDAAKQLMSKAGVPVVPGYDGDNQDDAFLQAEADKIGYPLLIKAVAGGGGKGMRRVDAMGDFAASLASARVEAQTAFGNTDVLIEKFITNPRHIEFQVFSDGQTTLHLLERDCSLQRRHQKVIEEAPAPGMPEDVRAEVGAIAVQAAQAIGYVGAGTVEFIVDGQGPLTTDKFFFMEMNTRLQVEHPVTEAILDVDLVEWQLNTAAGQKLTQTQSDMQPKGHAVEVRIYAERPETEFLPSVGTVSHLQIPDGVRFDAAVVQGSEVSPFYDPMIAKMIVHKKDRDTALAAMDVALTQFQIAGVGTNTTFLKRLVNNTDFRKGSFTTGLIDTHLHQLVTAATPCHAALGLAALALSDVSKSDFAGFSLHTLMRHSIALECQGETVRLAMEFDGDTARVFDENGVAADFKQGPLGFRSQSHPNWTAHVGGIQAVVFADEIFEIDLINPLKVEAKGQQDKQILSPMPGQVTAVHVAAGDHVSEGAPLATLEAMKMQHVLKAQQACVVETVHVAAGDQVAAKICLLEVNPLESPSD